METYCFIGSDKNAGKTTALNFIYDSLCRKDCPPPLCLTGIGINGERVDNFDGSAKPEVRLRVGSHFLTHARHLEDHNGQYRTLQEWENCISYATPTSCSYFQVNSASLVATR